MATVQYNLRKLLKYRLVTKKRDGNSKLQTYELTDEGITLLNEWGRILREILANRTKIIEDIDSKMFEVAKLVNMLTGVYDEASRISASYGYVGEASPGEKVRK